MAESNALVPVEQKEVAFYDDTIIAVRLPDGRVFVPIRPICELIGIDWAGQYRRLQRDPVLVEEIEHVDVTSTRRGTQGMICLPLDYVSGFLFGINPNRVKPELRDRVMRYQRECYRVLAEAFRDGRLTVNPSFAQLLENEENPAVQAYKMAQAIMKMAQQQILLDARLSEHGRAIASNTERIEELETRLGDPKRLIAADQAMHISQAVKTIALELGKRSGRNEFGGVYGELYRRFQIPSYRELPAAKYDEALGFLRQWYEGLVGDGDAPF